MTEIGKDPIHLAINLGIKGDIQFNLDNERFGAAIILVLSGIDTMASLNRPESQPDVTRTDFVNWCDRYMNFSTKDKPSSLELYGARCGMLHQYGSQSRLYREGKARMLIYCEQSVPEIIFAPNIDPSILGVSIKYLAYVFFMGIDQFLVDVFADPSRHKVMEDRLQWLMTVRRWPDSEDP